MKLVCLCLGSSVVMDGPDTILQKGPVRRLFYACVDLFERLETKAIMLSTSYLQHHLKENRSLHGTFVAGIASNKHY
ncbi:unnamed protein product [Caretta caretta]